MRLKSWIAMLTFTGTKDYRVIAGDAWVSQAAWRQNTAYLGEVIDDAMTPGVIKPFSQGFWRLFDEDRVPQLCGCMVCSDCLTKE